MNIPLLVPDIRINDINQVVDVLKSGMLVQGQHVRSLEENLKKYIEAKEVVAVSSGTATLHLALHTLGVGKGDEVIIPAFSFVATANVVELVGAKPVFVDIDIDTFNINVDLIEKNITEKTKAIIPVHEFGLSCEIEKVIEIANKYNLYVIEDAACAIGATYKGKHVGLFGDLGSFSFHPRKTITSGEGGVITTNSINLANRLRILRNHGIFLNNGEVDVEEAGFNYRLTDFQAALVNSQLIRIDESINKRRELAKIYNENLKDAIEKPKEPENCYHTYQTYHILLNKAIDRDNVITKLSKNGIGSNYGAQCIPELIYYKRKYNLDSNVFFPNSLNAYKNGLALPLYNNLDENQITYICNILNEIITI